MHVYCVMDLMDDSRIFTIIAPDRTRALQLLAQRYIASGIILYNINNDIFGARDTNTNQTIDLVMYDFGEFKEGVF